jgi:hypothetical protein
MANTQGFDLVAEITQPGILDILQGSWVSGILKKNTPMLPTSIGGIAIEGGQVQATILDVAMVPPGPGSPTPAGSLNLTFDLQVSQVQLQDPPLPLLSLIGFQAHVSTLIPVGSKPGSNKDVALLFNQISAADPNNVTLIPSDPVLDNLQTYLTDFVHQEFHNGDFPQTLQFNGIQFPQGFAAYTCDATVDLLDDPNDPAHEVQVTYPFTVQGNLNPQIQIVIPIHAKIYNIQTQISIAPDLLPMMGIETQLTVTTQDLTVVPGMISADFSKATVTVGTIGPAGPDYNGEGADYTQNAAILAPLIGPSGLADAIQSNLQSEAQANLLTSLPATLRPFSITYPSPTDMQAFIAQLVHDQLVAVGPEEIFPGPAVLPPQITLTDVTPIVLPNALAIAINSSSGSNASAIVNFVAASDIFAIAISAEKTTTIIQNAINAQFPHLPVVVNVSGHQVRLNSLGFSLASAIHFSGDITAINAILGKIDVDASFDEDVGLHWGPPDPSNNNAQSLVADTGTPDVHLSGLAWLLTILAGFITGGIAGVVIGVIIIDVAQQIASNIGSTEVTDAVTQAITAVGAWPSPISAFGLTVNSSFDTAITISPDGLLFGG